MGLLSPADQEKLRDSFADMTRPVRVLFFTQTLDCETCVLTRQILDELPPLSDKITIEELNVVIDRDKATQYGIDRAPGLALAYDDADADADAGETAIKDSRIRFLGAPSGWEFISLVQALMLVGGAPSNLSDESRARLAAVDKPVTMQVFTTPT